MKTRNEVYEVIDEELDYQDERDAIRLTKEDNRKDEEKSIADWLLYMRKHLVWSEDATYSLNEKEALAHIRKLTALGVRAMMNKGVVRRK